MITLPIGIILKKKRYLRLAEDTRLSQKGAIYQEKNSNTARL